MPQRLDHQNVILERNKFVSQTASFDSTCYTCLKKHFTATAYHCETKPFRWHIWMQNPAQNEVSNINFQICLESVLIHSKWSKLVPEHPLGPKKRFLTTKHPQNNFNKIFQNSKFAAQNEFLAFSSKQTLKTHFGGQV